MAVIVDYYKNDRIYNKELNELVPLNLLNYNADNDLRKLVKRFDELTFEKRKELSDYAYNIICDKDTLKYSLDNDKVSIGYYYNYYNEFNIEAYIGEEYAIGKVPFIVSHLFNKNTHIIRIERNFSYGYIPVIDLISMNEAYTNEYISKERIKIVKDELNVVNESLEEFYTKKLIKK